MVRIFVVDELEIVRASLVKKKTVNNCPPSLQLPRLLMDN